MNRGGVDRDVHRRPPPSEGGLDVVGRAVANHAGHLTAVRRQPVADVVEERIGRLTEADVRRDDHLVEVALHSCRAAARTFATAVSSDDNFNWRKKAATAAMVEARSGMQVSSRSAKTTVVGFMPAPSGSGPSAPSARSATAGLASPGSRR